MRYFEIRHSEFDTSVWDLSSTGRSRGTGQAHIQLKNWIYRLAGPINCFEVQDTAVDVIELLNRDYPRVIGCGDTETGHSSLLPSPLSLYNYPSTFTTISIPSCPKHRESECASLSLLLSLFFLFLFFHRWYQRRTNLFLFLRTAPASSTGSLEMK